MLSYFEVLRKLDEESKNIKKFGVSRLGLFGSFARNEQTEKSDIDILVNFEDGKESFDNYMQLLFFLEKLFSKKVDLVIADNVRDELKQEIFGSVKYASKL
ncbi:MAG: nucleotidyltransferase [Clostridiales bacterium GWC2_40_7]|nr:MAG: nucleotidyltransferase [Clostridiales bacterium GWC2_40_7]